jgi:hypothetical protein
MNVAGSIVVGTLAIVDIALVIALKKTVLFFRNKATNIEVMSKITGSAEYVDAYSSQDLAHVPVVTYSYGGKTYQRIPAGAERLSDQTFPQDKPIKIFISLNYPAEPSFTPRQPGNTAIAFIQTGFVALCLLIALGCTLATLLLTLGHLH